jgi:hypothetical protein
MSASPRKAPCALRGALAVLAAALAVSVVAPSAAAAADAHYEGIAADGSVAFFSTVDKLVPGDTDLKRDVYQRSFDVGVESYVTRDVSVGPTGGNNAFDAQYLGNDESGQLIFFSTAERLTASDTDSATDVYVRDLLEGKTALVSAGASSCLASKCGNADIAAIAVGGGIVADGSRVFFATEESLSPADEDAAIDVYARDLGPGGDTELTSVGTGSDPALFLGASAGGSRAIFTTAAALLPQDQDGETDLYLRDLSSSETKLVSTPGAAGACPIGLSCKPTNSTISINGAHVFFETNERISAEDTDSKQDVYDWSSGTASLASRAASPGNGTDNALFEGASADGTEVFFSTDEQLVGDADGAKDVYLRSNGSSTELVSGGDGSCAAIEYCEKPATLRWVSADGSIAVLSSEEPLLAADDDASFDIYARALPGGPTTLVSRAGSPCGDPECGDGPYNANFAGASASGSHQFFVTEEQMVEADEDASTDVYDRSGGTTTLISTGPINGNGPYEAQLQGVSTDGSRTFFITGERLTSEDGDSGQEDVYSRSGAGTLLVSAANNPELELGPPPPVLEETSPESPGSSTEPRVIGSEPEVEASIKLYATPDCSGEPVATGSAEQLAEPGILVKVLPGSTTTFRATAEAEGFASACSQPLSYTPQDPTLPPNEETGGGGGSGGAGGGSGPLGTPGSTPPPVPRTPKGVPYVTPVTRITYGPASKTRQRRPVFRFADTTGQPGTSFLCKVDRAAWKSCGSPLRLKPVAVGRHVFEVKGVNAAGAAEVQPVKRSFKVVSR